MNIGPHELLDESQDVVTSLQEIWLSLSQPEKIEKFKALSRTEAEDLFLELKSQEQAALFHELSPQEKRSWIRLLAPDDSADLIQHLTHEERPLALSLLDDVNRKEVQALLAYAEDDAGGLMNSRFIRLRPDMSVDEAIRYLRVQARTPVETIHYAYVLDAEQKLLGVISFRELLLNPTEKLIKEIMVTELIVIPEDMDQEEVSRLLQTHNLMALPVVDINKRMKGIVTLDDVVDVVKEEATEDIQKLGGMEALDAPYFQIGYLKMLKKRGGWLAALFFGEMLTATAMARYEGEIAKAAVLVLFIPLIISSGGNSGSQAATLIIRAMALGEANLRDWWRVLLKEAAIGVTLGTILGLIGFFRISFWPWRQEQYGEHYFLIGLTVAISLMGVVLWGIITGAMLPFFLRKMKFDPASSSAPFVATLVDVAGVVIYFTVASFLLRGVLL